MNLPDIPGAPVEVLLFITLSIAAIAGAVSVVTARDPFVSALSLLGNFASLGVLYLLLQQPFVAVAQVLVYAGAVVVLFLFVIAYLGDRREFPETQRRLQWLRWTAIGVGAALGAVLAVFLVVVDHGAEASVTAAFGGAAYVGEAFLTTFLLEFEVTSLVLLVAAIGGVVLGLTGRARHRRMRKLMSTRSADQQRRAYEKRERELHVDGHDGLEPAPPIRESAP